MSREPTFRQLELVRAIFNYTKRNGYAPSTRELARIMGMSSTNGISEMLVSVAKKNLIRIVPKIARGIVVTEEGQRVLGVIV